ncbi:hypothetical protein ACFQ36_02460 [Arthrobacter sp. GCM10027362]|uniref:hypothetical protein n=1 Tax=Arthrobacter sp. GCM10027362 TaxID=3273379 RepID=UPI00363C0163
MDSDAPGEASLRITVDLDISDPEAVRSYALFRAPTPEHAAMAAGNLYTALAIAMDPRRVAADVPGVRFLLAKVEAAEGHGTADQPGRVPADTGIGEDAVAALLEASDRVAGVPLELLGYSGDAEEGERGLSRHRARVLAGLLWHAAAAMTDELFNDIALLRSRGATAADIDETFVIDNLPPQFAHHYDSRFAARFLTVCVDLSRNLVSGWKEPTCVAQELAVRCLLADAEFLVEQLELGPELPPDWMSMLERAFLADAGSMMLYDPSMDGFEAGSEAGPQVMPSMRFDDWFRPFRPGAPVPPYAYPE